MTSQKREVKPPTTVSAMFSSTEFKPGEHKSKVFAGINAVLHSHGAGISTTTIEGSVNKIVSMGSVMNTSVPSFHGGELDPTTYAKHPSNFQFL